MNIRPFGEIDGANLDEYYESEVVVLGKAVEIDANFDSESIADSVLAQLAKSIENIEAMSSQAFAAISADWDLLDESEIAREYLQFHLEQFDEEEIKQIFGTHEIEKQQFLKALSIVRIGFYPEDQEAYVIFDIQFPTEHTNYLMAVIFSADGKISEISMES